MRKLTIREKNEMIYANFINGNSTDFKNSIKKMSKIQLLDLVDYVSEHENVNLFIHKIINLLSK